MWEQFNEEGQEVTSRGQLKRRLESAHAVQMAACEAYAVRSLAARSSRRPRGRAAPFALSASHASLPSPAMLPAQGIAQMTAGKGSTICNQHHRCPSIFPNNVACTEYIRDHSRQATAPIHVHALNFGNFRIWMPGNMVARSGSMTVTQLSTPGSDRFTCCPKGSCHMEP